MSVSLNIFRCTSSPWSLAWTGLSRHAPAETKGIENILTVYCRCREREREEGILYYLPDNLQSEKMYIRLKRWENLVGVKFVCAAWGRTDQINKQSAQGRGVDSHKEIYVGVVVVFIWFFWNFCNFCTCLPSVPGWMERHLWSSESPKRIFFYKTALSCCSGSC